MKIINHIPFKIQWLLLIFALLQENSNAQTCGSCAVPDCIGVKQYLNKPAAQAGIGKVSKNYAPSLTRTSGTFTTYATIRTDSNGQVGVIQEIQLAGGTTQISTQMQVVSASRSYKLYALTDAACANPVTANIANDGANPTFNPAWTNLQPNSDYKIAITTNLGVLSAGYEYKGFNIRYYHSIRPAAQFTFNCGAATTVGNFYANNINGQSGTLRIPITGATAGTANFSVTGDGFTGFAAVNIAAGQTWVSIPIGFDGSGVIGNHSMTVTSLHGTGSCTPVAMVKPPLATFGFNCASASSMGTFTANHVGNQAGTLMIPLFNTTEGEAKFSVSGGGFSGSLATTLTAGQSTVLIPIVYDGAGEAGNYAVTVLSPQSLGGCGLNINVVAPTSNFTFDCVSATVAGRFVLNNIANQNGYITIPLTSTSMGTATFLVTGTGFAGSLTTQLVNNQAIIAIPINYNGGGTIGSRSLTITSAQGTGSCSVQANVVAPSTAGAATFNCAANVTPIGTFVANGVSGQNGTITIDFVTQSAGEVTFTVSNNGFTGSLATPIMMGQTKANILVNYDGSGAAGNHAVTVTSSQATGNCTKNIPVQAICDFSQAVYNTGSNFEANGVNQNGTLVVPLKNVLQGSAIFTVSNNGFTGTLTTVLRDSQKFVAIPVVYNGSNPIGNHAVTVTSAQSLSGTCLAQVSVKSANTNGCDYIQGDTVRFVVLGQNSNNGYTTEYILTDSAGIIKYRSSTPSLANVNVGEYEGYVVNYQGVPAPNLTVGTQLNAIGGNCVSLSNALPIKICSLFQFIGNGAVVGNLISNGNGGQTGILYIPLTGGTGLPMNFGILSNGFTGGGTYAPNAGQDTIAIPFTFNGSGNGGLMGFDINGFGGEGMGFGAVWVMAPPPATPFTFDCASAVVNGTFIANQTTQSGSITVNLSGVTATSTTSFTVSGTNFSGGLINTELFAGQTSISIPIDYNGATPAGNYNITIGSPHGSNTCTIVIPVACNAPTVTSIVKTNPTLASCPNLDNGEIYLNMSGYNLRFSKNNGLTWQNSNGFEQLTAGTYVLRVQDSLTTCNTDTTIVLIAPNCNAAVEICNNGLDDDGDGKIDGEDDDCTPLACNATGNNIYFNLTNPNGAVDYTQQYVLTDTTMIIQQISSNMSFTNVLVGQYRVYGLSYRTAEGITGLTVGANWNAITGTYVEKTATALLFKICPTQFEVQLVLKSYNCATKKAQIQVQVKAQDGTNPFLMGNSTFRFDYDTAQMHPPILLNQDNFSNQAAASDSNYNAQTLTDSALGANQSRLTLNISYSGAARGAKLVPNAWTTVSTLEMTATDTATHLLMNWRTNLAQPPTAVMGIILRDTIGNYDTYQITSGGVFNPLNYDIVNYCTCTALDIKVLMEGPLNVSTGLMKTVLNQRGLLPGQTPIGMFSTPTPSGQPYNKAPWNYAGNETVATYDTTVVDWVLVTLRSDSASADSVVLRKAGLLHRDGRVSFVDNCWSLPFNKRYFVVVEHRNHLGVMSPSGQLLLTGGVIRHDFTQFNGYILDNPISTGQKLVSSKWTMLACDGKKNTYTNNFDINFLDSQYWKIQSGMFDSYRDSDFNLDADVNFLDSLLWKRNNGQYSGVPHR
jgi:hypothetical protein